MSMTTRIMIWMGCGLVIGSLIKAFASDVVFIQEYLVNGIFHVIGSIFINVLKMLVVPLLTFSLISGVCGIGDIGILRRISSKSFLLFILTTVLATSLAITLAVIIEPGQGFDITQTSQNTLPPPLTPSWTQILTDLIPNNPVAAYSEGNMLQIIFFTILFSIGILITGKWGQPIIKYAETMNEIMMQVVVVVMKVAPIGIFALMAKTFSEQGPELILPMINYFSLVAIVLILHATGTLMILLKITSQLSPKILMKKIRSVQICAFSTASSNATIPVTQRTAEKCLGIDNKTASFVIPLGATLNMDGTAITHGVATVFIANIYGVELGIMDYLAIVSMTVLASIGTAGIPGLGLAMLAMIFIQVGLPVEAIALILGVDRILDMLRTVVNVTGDTVIAAIIARSENNISMDIFNDPDAGQKEVNLPSRRNSQ
ncbi:MAG: dicarboxylate/amino acid:cation symporter [Gammaproteobacteria bacterium]|nr:dicarboxylate/amino acid:cation symporter [Gammaproteobacteria bacterium]